MKMILRSATLLLIAMAVAFSGCTSSYEDQVTPEETLTEEEGTLVSFSLDVAEITSATGDNDDVTRAASSYDSTIANLWILQYNSSGTRVYSKYVTSSFSDLSLTVYPSASTIVFVANTFSTTFGTSTSAETLTALGSATYDIAAHDDVLNSYYCIMSGSLSTSNISATTTNSVKLTRNAAKVNVKIVNGLSSDEWGLYSIETINIQDKAYYYPSSSSTYFPSTANSSTTDYEWSSTEQTSGLSSSGLTFYVPINKRGTVSTNTTESLKSSNALDDATAIKITFYSKTTMAGISYTFYLGANMTTDYNLLGNYLYSCTFTLSGTGTTDGRVESEEICIFEESDVSNCYIINPTSSTETIYIPIEGRINTFWGNQGYEFDCDNMLLPGADWEVDILWSDISSVSGSSTTSVSSSSGFTAERVTTSTSTKTPNRNAIEGGTALKISITSAFYNSTSMYGNVVVGIRNTAYSADQDNYLWSWHIWITNYNPDSVSAAPTAANQVGTATNGSVFTYGSNYWSSNGAKWIMDRPIGAAQVFSSTSMTSSARTMLYYQYGRKDPFSVFRSDGILPVDTYSWVVDTTGASSSVLSPTVFIGSVDGSGYTSNTKYTSSSIYWNDPKATVETTKSIFDPSPLGWKTPSSGMFADFVLNSTIYWNNGYPRYTVSGTTYAYYPAAGILYFGAGNFEQGGIFSAYWTSSTYYQYMIETGINTVSGLLCLGLPIIPIQE